MSSILSQSVHTDVSSFSILLGYFLFLFFLVNMAGKRVSRAKSSCGLETLETFLVGYVIGFYCWHAQGWFLIVSSLDCLSHLGHSQKLGVPSIQWPRHKQHRLTCERAIQSRGLQPFFALVTSGSAGDPVALFSE